MKVLVLGLGSMGKRRIRLLKDIDNTIEIYGYDNSEKRRNETKDKFNIKILSTYEDILKNNTIENVIICTPPLTHGKIALELIKNNKNIFSEINLVDDNYDEIIEEAKKRKKIAFLSSTFKYRKEIQWMKYEIKNSQKYQYRYHVGQYLPDWHHWENYKDFFVNNKKSNGCRELMGIEFPWIIDIFGEIRDMKVIKNKISDLEINYPDNYNILFKHENGNIGSINIDIVSRIAERKLDIYSEDCYIKWEGTPDSLYNYNLDNKNFEKISLYDEIKNEENYAKNIIENAYEEEIEFFLKSIKQNKDIGLHSYEKDKYIIRLLNEIEKDD